MKKSIFIPIIAFITLLTGCNSIIETVTSISPEEVSRMSNEACQQKDSQEKIAPNNSRYTKRLNKIAKNLGKQTENGLPLNYKVYMTEKVNAWAMANGCVRVYSGLMDLMNDEEVQAVVGHEIGHVELGHSAKATQTAVLTSTSFKMLANYGPDKIATIANSEFGALAEKIINAQFSQTQETDADNYSFDLLKRKHLNTNALATAFEKLYNRQGKSNMAESLLSSHPDSAARAKNIRDRIAKEGR